MHADMYQTSLLHQRYTRDLTLALLANLLVTSNFCDVLHDGVLVLNCKAGCVLAVDTVPLDTDAIKVFEFCQLPNFFTCLLLEVSNLETAQQME